MVSAVTPQRTFLGHPIGLYVLFFTDMWERFSYYGMRVLLMLYMLNYFRWSQQEASNYYKVYTSLVYVTPIIGGYLADRFLGNKWAVIIGAALMAIGHFLMAFEEFPIFMAALIFLIIGNGFFKPNMSTQVGRLYPANDGRRDGAYTIFYMGINLGAFLSPLACGWLAANTVGEYHSGFTLAGIGMVLGLVIYLLGQPLIRELPPDAAPVAAAGHDAAPSAAALTEAEAARQPSVLGGLSQVMPGFLACLGTMVFVAAPILGYIEYLSGFNTFMLAMAGFCLVLVAYVAARVHGGVRDRVLAILVLGIFVMFFWAAFEQAGNVLNVWADQQTDRYLTREAPPPQVIPQVIEDKPKTDEGTTARAGASGMVERFGSLFTNMVTLKPRPDSAAESSWADSFNPVPTAWFQSINALAIFVIAPLFAWMWVALDRRGWQPSIPLKMTLGLLLMSASMAVMLAAANVENRHSTVKLGSASLPAGIELTKEAQLARTVDGRVVPFHAGRLTMDDSGVLHLHGVLQENERDLLIETTAPAGYQEEVKELQKVSQTIDGDFVRSIQVSLREVPPGFDMKYAGIKKSVVEYRASDKTLIAHEKLADKEVKGLLNAGGEPHFRDTVHQLFVRSTQFRVSPWWLFWSYILATLGELCLSPVGLSMVSKLAPAKFATMLMGVWMLTSAFGNFAAGALGEIWGTIPPMQFFLLSTVVVGGAALVLFVLVKLVVGMMHGVK
ncbi:MAG: peptide MFS transporter [Gemmataceae bacterium]|nr:peptide MFS transporter [Gemmataceae bacterium]